MYNIIILEMKKKIENYKGNCIEIRWTNKHSKQKNKLMNKMEFCLIIFIVF